MEKHHGEGFPTPSVDRIRSLYQNGFFDSSVNGIIKSLLDEIDNLKKEN
jgi:hypothetical protein